MGLISRVSSRTYRDTSILTASMTETSEKPEKKSGWGNLLTNIIAGEPVARTSDESSPDEIDSPSEEGVVNLEKEQKREKKLTKKREAEKNESDSDDDGITTVSERQRKHREWEMIARTFPDRADKRACSRTGFETRCEAWRGPTVQRCKRTPKATSAQAKGRKYPAADDHYRRD